MLKLCLVRFTTIFLPKAPRAVTLCSVLCFTGVFSSASCVLRFTELLAQRLSRPEGKWPTGNFWWHHLKTTYSIDQRQYRIVSYYYYWLLLLLLLLLLLYKWKGLWTIVFTWQSCWYDSCESDYVHNISIYDKSLLACYMWNLQCTLFLQLYWHHWYMWKWLHAKTCIYYPLGMIIYIYTFLHAQ